jgi:hypothetical protein
MNKIDKLNHLGELLKFGAVSQEEFESLKSEIFNDKKDSLNTPIQKTKKPEQVNKNKDKVSLKSFNGEGGELVKAPDIQYLHLNDLSDSEISILKPFIRKKQIHSPAEMTSDEISITKKIYSALQLAQINSERPGLNYAFGSILSVLSAGAALYFFTISPCFIIIGAGGGVLNSIFISLFILNKVDATKLDRTFSYIAIVLSVFAIMIYFKE